jgi:hypothetical protein
VKKLFRKERKKCGKISETPWKKIIKKIESFFSNTLKSMKKEKECPLKFIYAQDKKLLTEPKKIMARWKNYFQELLEGKKQQDNDNENEEKEEYTETQENRNQELEITKNLKMLSRK